MYFRKGYPLFWLASCLCIFNIQVSFGRHNRKVVLQSGLSQFRSAPLEFGLFGFNPLRLLHEQNSVEHLSPPSAGIWFRHSRRTSVLNLLQAPDSSTTTSCCAYGTYRKHTCCPDLHCSDLAPRHFQARPSASPWKITIRCHPSIRKSLAGVTSVHVTPWSFGSRTDP